MTEASSPPIYQVMSGDLTWEGPADSHEAAITQAFLAGQWTSLGFAVRVCIKGVRGSSKWAHSQHMLNAIREGGR